MLVGSRPRENAMTTSGRQWKAPVTACGWLQSCVAVLASVAVFGIASAQPYPSRTIKLVVPYGPGGAGDVIARIVSEQLAKDLGVSVVVENKPGAGGMIGAQAGRERARPTATPCFWATRPRWSCRRTS